MLQSALPPGRAEPSRAAITSPAHPRKGFARPVRRLVIQACGLRDLCRGQPVASIGPASGAAAWEAQAQLRRAIHDEDRWREDLAEAVVFYDRAGMAEKAERLRKLLGRKLV